MIWCSHLGGLRGGRLDLLRGYSSLVWVGVSPFPVVFFWLKMLGFGEKTSFEQSKTRQVTTREFDHIHNSSHLRPIIKAEKWIGICALIKPHSSNIYTHGYQKSMIVFGNTYLRLQSLAWIFGYLSINSLNLRRPQNGVFSPFSWKIHSVGSFHTEIWQHQPHI